MTNDVLVRDVLLGLSAFVVGMCLYMDCRHIVALLMQRKVWQVWFVMIYAGIAIVVALIAELIFGSPGVPFTWRVAVYGIGLALILVGLFGVAYSVGRHDKRSTDRPSLPEEKGSET